MNVGVVTGFIPLPVKHLSETRYHELYRELHDAVLGAGAVLSKQGGTLAECWAYPMCTGFPPANPPPPDRYETPEINVMSHIVQHQRTTWAMRAMYENPEVDIWVWLDYGIMKQGAWRNKQITPESVRNFIRRLRDTPKLDVIPFPGIADMATVYPTGNNWRFCGSTHIWPRQFLPAINHAYKETLEAWITNNRTVPLDLPIWALVEQRYSQLPFRWYAAEYDASQLENYHDPALQPRA
jgi:hypothetical protein